ncbi:invasion associated locus B family protein [Rhizobium sp. 2YAF20]|jgi:invasion protein IalB|uniref:invasion associated locus B family protein n=1 Tax=Rhizobium sp. 2YAF20 TaxID=3233027 RepID=UPI003F9BEFD4
MMFKTDNKMRAGLSALALIIGAAAPAASFAQQAADPAAAAPAAGADASGTPRLGWYKTCSKQEDNDVCIVQNVIMANNGQIVTAIGLISIDGKQARKAMQVSVPTARLIAPGITMQIDGGKGQKLDYAVCLPDRCMAEVPLTDAMITALKKGTDVTFTSINFRRTPSPIKISLDGFGASYDGDPISQSKLAESQKSLQDSMQKKAEEARKKLEDAQKAAKQQ